MRRRLQATRQLFKFVLCVGLSSATFGLSGCSLCCSNYDFDYATVGGKHKRTDMRNGRLGSVLSDNQYMMDSEPLPLEFVNDYGESVHIEPGQEHIEPMQILPQPDSLSDSEYFAPGTIGGSKAAPLESAPIEVDPSMESHAPSESAEGSPTHAEDSSDHSTSPTHEEGEDSHAGETEHESDSHAEPSSDADHETEAEHDATGHDATGHDATGHDATGHDATGHDATGHDATGHDATGHDATGHDATGHDATGHDATGHDATGHDADSNAEHNAEDGHSSIRSRSGRTNIRVSQNPRSSGWSSRKSGRPIYNAPQRQQIRR